MIIYTVRIYEILNIFDTVLVGYESFKSKEGAIRKFPGLLVESDYPNEFELEKAMDKQLAKPFGSCYLLKEEILHD